LYIFETEKFERKVLQTVPNMLWWKQEHLDICIKQSQICLF